MSLLGYRPPLVTYRVAKARGMTAYQAQYLARKSYQLGRGYREGAVGGSSIGPIRGRALRSVALVGISVAMLIVLSFLVLVTLIAVAVAVAVVGAFL